jgi:hypothetical protein
MRTGYTVGHPTDPLLPLVRILAAAEARRGRTWTAGLLIGLSAGVETWGILGVAVLALAPRLRDAAVGTCVAAVTAFFAPCVLGGHFAMLSSSGTCVRRRRCSSRTARPSAGRCG